MKTVNQIRYVRKHPLPDLRGSAINRVNETRVIKKATSPYRNKRQVPEWKPRILLSDRFHVIFLLTDSKYAY